MDKDQTKEFRKLSNARVLCLKEFEDNRNWNPRTIKFILKEFNTVNNVTFSDDVFRTVLFIASRVIKCPVSIILSKTRIKKAVNVRQLCFYILCNDYSFTQQEIGDNFNRDHSSVIHGRNKIQDWIDINDKKTIEDLKLIRELL